MHEPLIQMSELSKHHHLGNQRIEVLKRINLTINHGDLVAIVGASGSGKSTLMNLMGLLDKANSGTYQLNGQTTSQLSDDDCARLRNQHIGFVFQQFNLLPRLTATDNIALPLVYANVAPEQQMLRVTKALQAVNMQSYSHHRPGQLSGGQQQRVAIARALINQPQLVLADEPTGALDSKTSAEVMALFASLHETGRTVVIITHDNHIANQCQRIFRIDDGCLHGGMA